VSDRNFILAPEITRISIVASQPLVLLNSLALVDGYEEYQGVDDALVRIAQQMTDEEKHTNLTTIILLHDALMGWREDFQTLEEYIQHIDTYSGRELLEIAHSHSQHKPIWKIEKEAPDLSQYTLDVVTNSWDKFLELNTHYHYDEPLSEEKTANLRLMHAAMQDTDALKNNLMSFIEYMWEKYFKADWKRHEAAMRETVEAFQEVGLDTMTKMEALRFVTGRDFTDTWVEKALNATSNIQFVPSPFVGPYVGFGFSDSKIRLFFYPHLPEGTQRSSSALDRSEILVRLNALADDTRLRIIELLTNHDELCAQDIIQMLDLSQSAASRHLRQLSATRFLNERRREGSKCYNLNYDQVEHTLNALQRFIS